MLSKILCRHEKKLSQLFSQTRLSFVFLFVLAYKPMSASVVEGFGAFSLFVYI